MQSQWSEVTTYDPCPVVSDQRFNTFQVKRDRLREVLKTARDSGIEVTSVRHNVERNEGYDDGNGMGVG